MSLYFDDTLDRTCVYTEFGGLKQMSPSPVGYVRYMGNEDTVQCMPQQGHFPSVNMKKKSDKERARQASPVCQQLKLKF